MTCPLSFSLHMDKEYRFPDLLTRVDGRSGASGGREASAPCRALAALEALSDLPPLGDGHGIFDGRYTEEPKTSYQRKLRKGCERLVNHEASPLTGLERARVGEMPRGSVIPGANWHFLPNLPVEYYRDFEDTHKHWTHTLRYDYPSSHKDHRKRPVKVFCPRNRKMRNGEEEGCPTSVRGECKVMEESPEDTLIPRSAAHIGLFHKKSCGRMDPSTHAGTITCKDSLGQKMGRMIHPEEDRRLTPRECARLQGFPDSFIFHGDHAHQHRQIGNAVPPPLAEALGRAIAASLTTPHQ